MDLGLKGKVAVVTGGSVGIGLAIAEGLAAEGVDIVIAARNVERVRGEAGRIAKSFGVRAEGVACDVATREGTEDLIADVKRLFGGADILINNAGTGSNETVMEAPDEKWQAYWDLHVMAAVRFARGLAPLMKKRGGGVILHNASICAAQPLWYEPIYNVTKAALMMFSKTLSTELVGDNIRVELRQPGSHPHAGLDQDRKTTHRRQRRRLAGLSRQRRARTRADQALRHTAGIGQLLRLSLLGSRELFSRLNLFRRRRNAEIRLSAVVLRRRSRRADSVRHLRHLRAAAVGP